MISQQHLELKPQKPQSFHFSGRLPDLPPPVFITLILRLDSLLPLCLYLLYICACLSVATLSSLGTNDRCTTCSTLPASDSLEKRGRVREQMSEHQPLAGLFSPHLPHLSSRTDCSTSTRSAASSSSRLDSSNKHKVVSSVLHGEEPA